MKRIKITHVHSDPKFVNNSKLFLCGHFDNTIIVIESANKYIGELQNQVRFYKKEEFLNILEVCKDSDLVVLYDLDSLKVRIALALPRSIKVAWRFFGYEIYGRRKELVFSDLTFRVVQKEFSSANFYIRKYLYATYSLIRFGSTPEYLFKRAVDRINYMFVLSREEYNFLSQHWGPLPLYINFTPDRAVNSESLLPSLYLKQKVEKPLIIIGNNRSAYNNHLDVIELIEKSCNKHQYNFTFLFNYGVDSVYAGAVREAAKGKEYIKLLEDFIPSNQFDDFYDCAAALVINGYRQMAGANIFLALKCGVKVYLNRKNVFMRWLVNEGFKIYSIENFIKDLETSNVYLDEETANYNLRMLINFSQKYNVNRFQEGLFRLLTS